MQHSVKQLAILLLIATSVSVSGCSEEEFVTSPCQTHWDGGVFSFSEASPDNSRSCYNTDGKRQGYWETIDLRSGRVASKGKYVNGKPHGLWVARGSEGRLEHGKKQGKWLSSKNVTTCYKDDEEVDC